MCRRGGGRAEAFRIAPLRFARRTRPDLPDGLKGNMAADLRLAEMVP